MRSAKAFLALLVFAGLSGRAVLAAPPLGAQGPEGAPNRAQPWRVPTPDADIPARAVLYRPPGEGPFRLAVINDERPDKTRAGHHQVQLAVAVEIAHGQGGPLEAKALDRFLERAIYVAQ